MQENNTKQELQQIDINNDIINTIEKNTHQRMIPTIDNEGVLNISFKESQQKPIKINKIFKCKNCNDVTNINYDEGNILFLDNDNKVKIIAETTISNKKKNTLISKYTDAGYIGSRCNYIDNQKNGEYWEYRFGCPFKHGFYKQGQKNGKWEKYSSYIDGQLILKCQYKNDKKDGKYAEYYDNGSVKTQGSYKNDQKDGEWTEYDYGDKVSSKGSYENGKKNGKWIETSFYNKRFECNYLDDKKHGECKEYNHLGKLLSVKTYQNGVQSGPCQEYYDNGKLKFEGECINGKKQGKGKEYNKDGKIIFEGEYDKDIKNNGIFTEYKDKQMFQGEYKKGVKTESWQIKNGKKTNIQRTYDEKGRIVCEGEFKNGKIYNGIRKSYPDNFVDDDYIYMTITYTNGKIDKQVKIGNDKVVKNLHKESFTTMHFKTNKVDKPVLTYTAGVIIDNGAKKTEIDNQTQYVTFFGQADGTLIDNLFNLKLKYDTDYNSMRYFAGAPFIEKQYFKVLPMAKNELKGLPMAFPHNNKSKLEIFIVDHGNEFGDHCLNSIDIEKVSTAISNTIANSLINGKPRIQLITLKFINCYGRTYDSQHNDFMSELLRQIYTQIQYRVRDKVDTSKLPTILISRAAEESVVATFPSCNDKEQWGYKIIAEDKEYFKFGGKDNWERVKKIVEYENEKAKDYDEPKPCLISLSDDDISDYEEYNPAENYENINDPRKELKLETDPKLIELFSKITKEEYRQIKHSPIIENEPKEINNDKINIGINNKQNSI